jgi:phospholipid/cholesterol/gamma-HCH transport system permease protein
LAARAASPTTVLVSREGDTAVVRLSGPVRLRDGLPSSGDVVRALDASPPPRLLQVDATAVEDWDTALVVFLARVYDACTERHVALDTADVPRAARRILGMARQDYLALQGVREDEAEDQQLDDQLAWAKAWTRLSAEAVGLPAAEDTERPEPLLAVIGYETIGWARSLGDKVEFLGFTVIAIVRMLLGRTRKLRTRFFLHLQQAGVETLPIVAVMAFAIGVVLALIGVGQLQKVGAAALVARLVSIVVLREMGSLMVGIAIAGRLGSAIAAEIATMATNGETDALRVMGIDPHEFLVAPRVVATGVAGVLLVVYANALGLFGGLFAGVAFGGFSAPEYVARMVEVLGYKHMISGLIKGLFFGAVTAVVACYYGLRSGRSAGAVGLTVRRAVVGAVVGVVLADTAITLFFKWVKL